MYDYLIVGSGFFGSVYAHEATKRGSKCLVIDKRSHIGGNCFTKNIEGINVHMYGPHIFNTNSTKIWNYINQFCEFEQYVHRVKVNFKGKIYSFPINLLTLYQLWGCSTPEDARQKITEKQISSSGSNLKDWVVSELGEEIFEIFYKGYSEKQWMRPCEQIPASIGKRLPIRYDYNDAYHDTKYCGIPKDGNYTQIFEKLLDGIEVQLETDFKDLDWKKLAKKLVYCGPIDELFNYKHGPLEYRSLSFKTEIKDTDNFQGVSQMNFTSVDVPWTRIVEHKWFSPKPTKKTVITYEYPESWDASKERFYPVGDQKNNDIYKKYKDENWQRWLAWYMEEYPKYRNTPIPDDIMKQLKQEFEKIWKEIDQLDF